MPRRIQRAFLELYGRPPTDSEVKLGLDFVASPGAESIEGEKPGKDSLTRWEQYAQVLLTANEFMYID